MMKFFLLLFPYLTLCLSFVLEYFSETTIKTSYPGVDSIFVLENITDNVIARFSLGQKRLELIPEVNYPTTGVIQLNHSKEDYLVTLIPGEKINITIHPDSTISTGRRSDSLLNYLWKSNNKFIAQYSNFIFNTQDTDSILSLSEHFIKERDKIIDLYTKELSQTEKSILHYQNEARVHSFLFYFGRMIKKFPPKHPFFKFTANIDPGVVWLKTLADNVLYKFEITYLSQNDTVKDIDTEIFIKYIEQQTPNKDLCEFLKAYYLKFLMMSPSYLSKHEKLFDYIVLKKMLEREKNNPYYALIQKPANSYFSTLQGVIAYNFTAEKTDGSTVQLADFKGKLVFIDNWATWCGPCISQKPKVIQMSQKYRNNPRIIFLMISKDVDKQDWINFLKRKNQTEHPGLELIIQASNITEYTEKYLVSFIPKYVLIDEHGKIINANLPELSIAVENLIDEHLKRLKE